MEYWGIQSDAYVEIERTYLLFIYEVSLWVTERELRAWDRTRGRVMVMSRNPGLESCEGVGMH